MWTPEHLVGSHSTLVSGKDEVRDVLTAYRDAITHMWDTSVRAIDEDVPSTSPPERSRGRRTGWYDFTPASLNPLSREHGDRALVDLDVVLAAEPLHRRANEVQAEACVGLRKVSTSANEKGFYRSGEVLARQRLEQA